MSLCPSPVLGALVDTEYVNGVDRANGPKIADAICRLIDWALRDQLIARMAQEDGERTDDCRSVPTRQRRTPYGQQYVMPGSLHPHHLHALLGGGYARQGSDTVNPGITPLGFPCSHTKDAPRTNCGPMRGS
jgi:hypothetical protein